MALGPPWTGGYLVRPAMGRDKRPRPALEKDENPEPSPGPTGRSPFTAACRRPIGTVRRSDGAYEAPGGDRARTRLRGPIGGESDARDCPNDLR